MASGFTLATAYAASNQSGLYSFYALWAIIFTLAAFISRSASLIRNGRINYKSNLRTAIGVRHNQIQQKAQGAMGGSYNTREFFHGKTLALLKSVKWIFLIAVFLIPAILLITGLNTKLTAVFATAFAIQYLGLIAERWFFCAQADTRKTFITRRYRI